MKTIAVNKKANFNYNITDKIEAGLVLTGTEVKSLRIITASIKESYIGEKESELWLFNCHISEYKSSNSKNFDPLRQRKILLSKKQKNKLIGSLNKDGFSLVPMSLYFNNRGIAKILVGLGKGKKLFDKRQTIKKKEWGIQKQRILKEKNR